MSKQVDLVVIPYHDWRKVQREGARTRDAHLITCCVSHGNVGRVVIVNRPMTVAEMLYKRRSWKTKGEVVARGAFSRLVRVADSAFALDFFDRDSLGPVFGGKRWFFSAYGRKGYLREIEKFLARLGVVRFSCISFNVFAAAMFAGLPAEKKLFDAWDNFLKFPEHKNSKRLFREAYERCFRAADFQTTNSASNKSFFESDFGVVGCRVIGNGVDLEMFSREYDQPSDLRGIQRPIVGVGAKVTHLLDHELMNHVVEANPDLSFVLVGQIVDKAVFGKINRRRNFFYLGDKHYDEYPAYVKAFDVCLVPYVVGEKEHGGDPIKLYEYLAANKPVVTTRCEGVSDEYGNVFVADSYDDFCKMIRAALSSPCRENRLPDRLTWRSRTEELLRPLLSAE